MVRTQSQTIESKEGLKILPCDLYILYALMYMCMYLTTCTPLPLQTMPCHQATGSKNEVIFTVGVTSRRSRQWEPSAGQMTARIGPIGGGIFSFLWNSGKNRAGRSSPSPRLCTFSARWRGEREERPSILTHTASSRAVYQLWRREATKIRHG